MYCVSFSAARVVEYEDPRAFPAKARAWLHQREGENTYLLGVLPAPNHPLLPPGRLFTVEHDGSLVAAGVLTAGACLLMSWATADVVSAVIAHAIKNRWSVSTTCAPAHVSHELARALATESRREFSMVRAERVYQLTSVAHELPAGGRLEVAHASDKPLLSRWFAAFLKEAGYVGDPQNNVDVLIDSKLLYLWKAPEPVAMAAWVAPSLNGGCINYVYVPAELRGRGHAKAVTSVLATQMLASGLHYCFILADVKDGRLNKLYQSIGASSVCDLLHCAIAPQSLGPRVASLGAPLPSAGPPPPQTTVGP